MARDAERTRCDHSRREENTDLEGCGERWLARCDCSWRDGNANPDRAEALADEEGFGADGEVARREEGAE